MPQPINDLEQYPRRLGREIFGHCRSRMSLSSWLVGGMVPGIERQPRKKLAAPDPDALLRLLHRWRDEAVKAGTHHYTHCRCVRAGRDGFWLARWLGARKIEAYVIHPTSIAVSREQRRAKTDRLDIGLLKRLIPWLAARRERSTAPWQRSQPWKGRMQNARTASGSNWLGKRTRYHQPHESSLGASRHSQLQPKIAQGTRAACDVANAGRWSHSAQHTGRAPRARWRTCRFIDEQIKQIEATRLEQSKQAPQQRVELQGSATTACQWPRH